VMCEREIEIAQCARCRARVVRYELDPHFVVDVLPLGVMLHLFGLLADGVHEDECGLEIFELEIKAKLPGSKEPTLVER